MNKTFTLFAVILIGILLQSNSILGAYSSKHIADSSSSDSSSTSGSDSHSFQSGNILLTDINGFNPNQILEYTMDGVNVRNYSTWVENNSTTRCVPQDLAFLDSDTLLLLDSQQGIFYATTKGNVKGFWNGMWTNPSHGQLGCNLERFFVSQDTQQIYITSTDAYCDSSYTPAVFVYDFNGNYKSTITYDKFNTTLGVAVNSKGSVWVVDVNEIFVFHASGDIDSYDPIPNKIAYNGIQLTSDDTMLVAVPSPVQDLIIELDTNGNVLNEIKLVGNTTADGSQSGIPCTIDQTSDGHIIVEVPYASKKEGKGENVIQIYSSKGNLKGGFGGHSCKLGTGNLCIPQYGMVVIA